MTFAGWIAVATILRERAERERKRGPEARLNEGQRRAIEAVADRVLGAHGNTCRGVVIADEVGMGKTRVATAVVRAVVDAGGRAAIGLPGGLGFQWKQELRGDDLETPDPLRALHGFYFPREGSPLAWATTRVLLVSQHFANWHMGGRTHRWRWGLLPALVAEHRLATCGRVPPGYRRFEPWIQTLAKGIYLSLASQPEARQRLDDWAKLDWGRHLCNPSAYGRHGALGAAYETVVGWSLGRFDLIVLDEAHKARGTTSGVSRLLQHILVPTGDPARLALTATPVALHIEEWAHTLSRVGLSGDEGSRVVECTRTYATATQRLREGWRTGPEVRDRWRVAARAFEDVLRPYVIRRDKREEVSVQAFGAASPDSGPQGYRKVCDLVVEPRDLSPSWRRVVLAAEGLSAAVHGGEDPVRKRLRLTLSNGHGLAALLDETGEEPSRVEADEDRTPRARRAATWQRLLRQALPQNGGDAALLEHPQIVAAAAFIDQKLRDGHKVLVFGLFSRPMRALRRLVNARARVRALVDPTQSVWPQEAPWDTDATGARLLPDIDRLAALQQDIAPQAVLDAYDSHVVRYGEAQNQRRWFQRNLTNLLRTGLGVQGAHQVVRDLAEGLEEADQNLVSRACLELLSVQARTEVSAQAASDTLANATAIAFRQLVEASLDLDAFDDDDDETATDDRWVVIRDYLADEFGAQRGRVARTLDGNTKPATRRLLQAAFNRAESNPRVLIAQSTVGREGLNLHEACRVVLLFHPEWNPGVVEQQIGRVDRLGSRWQRELEEALREGRTAVDLPRIEVYALLFRGTYDEHHWRVLKDRWDSLRAQLHGVVIPLAEAGDDPELVTLAQGLNEDAPSFSP
jgi:hypothetical protein